MFLLQILNPNPDAMSKMITENASEEFLYSLSNYCALQVGRDTNYFEINQCMLDDCSYARILILYLIAF